MIYVACGTPFCTSMFGGCRYLWYIIAGPGKKAAAHLSWTPYLRHWSLWKHLAAYFPVR